MHFVSNRLTWGEHRGGMFVELRGRDKDPRPLQKTWHLIAEEDTGPNVPLLAIAAIIRAHLEGRPPAPGARNATGELTLSEFEPLFDELQIKTGIRKHQDAGEPLFRRIIGNPWPKMSDAIRTLHGETGDPVFSGRASVRRGRSLLSRAVGSIVGMPAATKDTPISVTIERTDGRERWTRDFDGHRFSSEHTIGSGRMDGLICERFGPIRIGMALTWDGDRLRYTTRAWSLFGLPLPKRLAPGGDVSEFVTDGKFHFHVEVRMPLAGHVVTYEGWLLPAA